MNRYAGVLMSVTSLPSPYGIGCFDGAAYAFVDWLAKAGQRYWQILPLGATAYGLPDNSPYQAYSAFAGSPYLISLETLIGEGVLTREECDAVDFGSDPAKIDFDKLHENRLALLHKAYERSNIAQDGGFHAFCADNAWWLDDYALFMALKTFFREAPFQSWPKDIRMHWDFAVDYYNRELYFDVEFHKYLQYKFAQQWSQLKAYANARHIRIVGDIPIYVSPDGADVWAHPDLFQLNSENQPTAIAGCPPDAFAADGQVWGNPLYRWERHRETGYAWWMSRMWYSFKLYDVVRIDHFRGFDEYFSIPADAKTARGGHWEKGPGMELFNAIEKALGPVPLIAEDLGVQTDEVKKLLEESGFPGMRVLIFGFTPDYDNEHLPHNYKPNSIVYTSTHDSQTVCEQIMDICSEPEKQFAYRYLRTSHAEAMGWSAIKCVWASSANIAMTTLQDLLSLGADSRMNTPATIGGKNWRWRVRAEALNPTVSSMLGEITKTYMRG